MPSALLQLQELLARNNHENWAALRLAEGWRWGAARDDAAKHHPCLVPYEDLPDSEKEYDRRSAMETLKTILLLGYRIEPPPPVDGTNFVRELMRQLAENSESDEAFRKRCEHFMVQFFFEIEKALPKSQLQDILDRIFTSGL